MIRTRLQLVLAGFVFTILCPTASFAAPDRESGKKDAPNTGSAKSDRTIPNSESSKSRADVKSEGSRAGKSGAITGNSVERHYDPCKKRPELEECKISQGSK